MKWGKILILIRRIEAGVRRQRSEGRGQRSEVRTILTSDLSSLHRSPSRRFSDELYSRERRRSAVKGATGFEIVVVQEHPGF